MIWWKNQCDAWVVKFAQLMIQGSWDCFKNSFNALFAKLLSSGCLTWQEVVLISGSCSAEVFNIIKFLFVMSSCPQWKTGCIDFVANAFHVTLFHIHIRTMRVVFAEMCTLPSISRSLYWSLPDRDRYGGVPPQIFSLYKLRTLVMASQAIRFVPREINWLNRLSKLLLNDNPLLEELSADVGHCPLKGTTAYFVLNLVICNASFTSPLYKW